MATGGDRAVLFALVGNGALTVIKLVAYIFSGSAAMMAEAIHSLADTGNQTLLLVGIRSSRQKASKHHPFGFGKDRFVWALLSAAGIFFIGCGVTVTHGIHALLAGPQPAEPSWIPLTVLSVALVVDGYVMWQAYRALNNTRNGQPWREFLATTDDTTTVAVLFEDGIATLGVMVAMCAIVAVQWLGWWWADGAASVVIGVLLGITAIFLGKQNRTYLIDRAVGADVQRRILDVIRGRGPVKEVLGVRSRIVGSGVMSFNADIEFDGAAISESVLSRVNLSDRFEGLKTAEDLDLLLDEHAAIVVEELGNEVDRIEAAVRSQVPGAAFIQLEVD